MITFNLSCQEIDLIPKLPVNPVDIGASPGVDTGLVFNSASVSPGDNATEDTIVAGHGSTRVTLCKARQDRYGVA